ncbi:MAG: Gfo/Idh/MocA family oxidoreductase, partial [Pontiellaceae bacterium]|nr:Gfo/Idh/MocA family oxidoreductase [Pontiellaceae bacterium]
PNFFRSMEKTGEGTVVAAASKSMHRAKSFQKKTRVERIYPSYEKMLDQEQLDAVYVATSHNFHYENTLHCLNRGLPVLVEKAFTRNAVEAEKLIALARRKNLFLMEAMWTRFNPAIVKLRELLHEGIIGDVKRLNAAFCVRMNPCSLKTAPWNRMYSPRLAGGALLDLGVYPITFARMVFGKAPVKICGSAEKAWTGVDKTSEYLFDYSGGKRAELISSFGQSRPRDAVITGTAGQIRVPVFMHPDHFIVTRTGHAEETIRIDPERLDNGSPGFQHEIREVHRCLRGKLLESPLMPLDETLEIMQTMDALRTQWGVKYPGE